MTETDHKPYTDADVETAVKAMWRVGAPCDGSFTRAEVARIVLDALTAAGWRPPTRTTDLPLLDLTAAEVAAITANTANWLQLGDDPVLRSVLAKLRTEADR